MEFKKELIEKLINKIPENINNLELKFPKNPIGYVRFENDKLNSIYLENLKDKYNNNIILKFYYRDFHYREPSFIFNSIYICGDDCNEYRYDRNLNLNSIYLKGISIPANLPQVDKLHMLSILLEWQKFNKILGKDNYISEYQIKKDNKKVSNPYVVFSKKLENQNRFDILKKMVDELDINKITYFQKCKIDKKQEIITKENIIYLIINNETYKRNDG